MSVDRFRAGKRLWNPEEDALLAACYPHEPTAALAREVRRTPIATYARAHILGLAKSAEYMASPEACRLRRGDNVGAPFRFKKGQAGYNWRPVGSQRVVDGYLYTKISDHRNIPWTRNWRPTHILLWEQHHGPVPRAHALAFVNGDRTDVRLDNLELITRRELMARNTVHNLPKPLVEVVQLLGALNRRIRRKTRTRSHEEQDRRPA